MTRALGRARGAALSPSLRSTPAAAERRAARLGRAGGADDDCASASSLEPEELLLSLLPVVSLSSSELEPLLFLLLPRLLPLPVK